ncbi:2-amino-4-hydroxy-6-hydroxymethyldihydropteridine diphosphokinase [Carboxylicivirga sediminis]|uniref:2-amino-4-hydroxy-6-hydroxymethyldihydropteridine pyrophosphokinase n=1 Tax=Carboxylicivirga sediminis TaxID=2006564 RepID=A0A941IZ31_9BACT|nr:2-amino-4-hydroxy-6-hydroxymethyldihydropteridine diphosphokinase [Carboxylicivirga sediminis]MBR8537193.1 2-amino-4-hydroxy-6-hydroxymethyldihydropteridine diphosphokinase [Carboxylicivirga sediminis]
MKQDRAVYAVIGLGSNISAETKIPEALHELNRIAEVIKTSKVMTTQPIGITEQADFSNCAVLILVKMPFEVLNAKLKAIEDKMGRDRSRPKFGPREIDLDIVVYDDEITDDDYYTRDFLKELVNQVWAKK